MSRFRFRVWCQGEMYSDCIVGGFPQTVPAVYGSNGWVNLCGSNQDCVIMQSTGLRDAKGTEIFEGDILACTGGGDRGIVVVWDGRTCGFALEKAGWAFRHYFGEALEAAEVEVTGNIYANPELAAK